MTLKRAPFAALDDILSSTRCMLISFDGPVCSLFAGTPAVSVADSLRGVITKEGVHMPQEIADTGSWLELLSYAASMSPDLAARVESDLTAAESSAIATAEPTSYVHEVLQACCEYARPVAIISNHSEAVVRAYLILRDLNSQVALIAARNGPETSMPPQSSPIELAVTELATQSSECVLVGSSPSEIQAAKAAGAHSIGYAKNSREFDHLVDAGAEAIIVSMADLALRLRARPPDIVPPEIVSSLT
jgi:phosphoglycolate phosphatase